MSSTASYQIPDLPALFSAAFELRTSRHCRAAGDAAHAWAHDAGFLDTRARDALPGVHVGLLAALCVPTADRPQVVRVAQFLVLLVHWWDASFDARSRAAWEGLWTQFCRTTTKSWQTRFLKDLADFEDASLDAGSSDDALRDIDSYMAWGRRASGFSMALSLVEYAEELHLSDEVLGRLTKLRETTLDLLIWMHDIASYNIQQAREHNHNAVAVLMASQGISLQAAMNRAGQRLKTLVADFLAEEAALVQCSWGPYVDRDVRVLIVGLRDCAVGTAHWIYKCDRYFLGKGEDVRAFGWVFLLPKVVVEEEEEGD